MTESLEKHDSIVHPVRHDRSPNRLNRALAWVGIVAGSLFIVGSVFFSGYFLGQQSGGGHHGPHAMMLKPFHGPGGGGGPMMGPGGPMGPDDGPRAERLTPPTPPTQTSTPARP